MCCMPKSEDNNNGIFRKADKLPQGELCVEHGAHVETSTHNERTVCKVIHSTEHA